MENRGSGYGKREQVSEVYTPEQVEGVLNAIGVQVVGETGNDFLCLCPFHGNKFTPSFSVSRMTGVYICFNHACSASGNLMDLIRRTTKANHYEAMRLVQKQKSGSQITLKERRERKRQRQEAAVFPQEVLDRMKADFWNDSPALEYMRGRGFKDPVLEEYDIGFSAQRNQVVTPMHDVNGTPVGVIGRSIEGEKRFNNSVGLPTSTTLWNMHRARKHGETAIIVEANFDALAIAQAGYPNVVACLGGNFSSYHTEQLARNFASVIIMTDNDDSTKHRYEGCRKCFKAGFKVCRGHNPGRELGLTIASEMAAAGRVARWAAYDDGIIYPHGAKDAGDMTEEEIRQCINNSVSGLTYKRWALH